MEVLEANKTELVKIEEFPYKGTMHKVHGTSISWLSKYGDDGNGIPEYGLRLFTVEPDGKIPVHSHFYVQTMYFLEGKVECFSYDKETEEVTGSKKCEAGHAVYIPSMEPHSIVNIGNEKVSFLCCICNVYDGEETL